jgi:hypothetical protein
MICKKIYVPPFQMTEFAWQQTNSHRILRRRSMRQGAIIIFRLGQERLISCFIFVQFRILRMLLDKHRPKCVPKPLENWRVHPTVKWPFIISLS